MKVLLLYLEFPDTFWSFKHALKFIRKKASLPPLGLLTVAAMLPKEWAKRLVDVKGHIYAPGPYYRRFRTFLREYQRPKISGAFKWPYPIAFLHANVRLGIFGRERFHYWGLLFWTFFHRPTLLSQAVTLSIYGHHFRKTCAALEL